MKNIPIIANGGIFSYSDAENLLKYTKCDGVMSAEALLENPRLFSKPDDNDFRERYIINNFCEICVYIRGVHSCCCFFWCYN